MLHWWTTVTILLPLGIFGQIILPKGWSKDRIQISGDLMLGIVQDVTKLNKKSGECSGTIDRGSFEIVEVASHLIRHIISNSSLFGAIRLGLTVFDDCESEKEAIVRMANFLPNPVQPDERYVAIMCCARSDRTRTVNVMLQSYNIPQISFKYGFEETSATTPAKYLVQAAPTEQMKLKVVVDILIHFGWTSVLVVTTADQFGFDMLSRFKLEVQNTAVCIIDFIPIHSEEPDSPDFRKLVLELDEHKTVTAVVLLIYRLKNVIHGILTTLQANNFTRQVVWIRPNSFTAPEETSREARRRGIGAIRISEKVKEISPKQKLSELGTLADFGKDNPWFDKYWALCNCSWNSSWSGCADVSSNVSKDCNGDDGLSLFLDAFSAVVLSLQKYLQNGSIAPFDHLAFFNYLQNTSFDGYNGRMQFNENGVVQDGAFTIYQITGMDSMDNYVEDEIGTWSSFDRKKNMTIDRTKLIWSEESIPTSVCVFECSLNQYRKYLPSTCCWHCTTCPPLTWPSNGSCHLLPASSIGVNIQYGIITICALGISITLVTLCLYWHYRNSALIKASCRETSMVCLVGVALNFAVPFILLPDQTNTLCCVRRFAFSTAFAAVYVPVLIKCVKILRVFTSRSVEQPSFISPKAQLIVVFSLLLLQTAFVALSLPISEPLAVDTMPNRYEPVVERICMETPVSFFVMLLFDLVVLASCAIMALRTRKLPENFNESSQIAFCVNTILLLMIVLIPAHFFVGRAGMRAIILSVSLVANGFVCLATLFLSKLYVVHFKVVTTSSGVRINKFTARVGDSDTHH